jgi:hypothetical protein
MQQLAGAGNPALLLYSFFQNTIGHAIAAR